MGAKNMAVPQAGSNPLMNDIDKGVEEELELLQEYEYEPEIPDLQEIIKNAIREWIRAKTTSPKKALAK